MTYNAANRSGRKLTARDYFFQRRDRRETALLETFDEVNSRQNLFRAWNQIEREKGKAGGPDHVSPRDLTPAEAGQYCEVISRAILAGDYVSGWPRNSMIEKDTPGQLRQLSIPNIADKIVATALHRTFAPRFDKLFLPCSHGYRPGRGRNTLLKQLVGRIESDHRSYVASDDVKAAFDCLPIDDCIDTFHWAMGQIDFPRRGHDRERFGELLHQLLLAGDAGRTVGIGQGNPISPLMLNLLLHRYLDMPLEADYGGSYVRYADDLYYAGRNSYRCDQFLRTCKTLLDALRLKLKAKAPTIINLQQEPTTVLGYQLKQDANRRLGVTIGLRPWHDIEDGLRQAHHNANPPQKALEALRGWIRTWRPALGLVDEVTHHQLLALVRRAGFLSPNMTEEIQRLLGESCKQGSQMSIRQFVNSTTDPTPMALATGGDQVALQGCSGRAASPLSVRNGTDVPF